MLHGIRTRDGQITAVAGCRTIEFVTRTST